MTSLSFEEWQKVEIRIAEILSAEKVPDADKLLKLEVDLGGQKRQLVAGIAGEYSPEDIIGKKIPMLVNLEPKRIRGIESQGMILAATDGNGKPVLMHPDREIPAGSKVR
ncbi:MAG: methionine--tRNA ligase subunit beta [Candidatus Aenigmarchaeota archaeon]|nr:methionine--tRNA ligase subunit beta [Candidatus Aenigmarchaeota archaeon]